MKKVIVIGLLLFAANANAGDVFGAALKPSPSITLFGQKITWPIPSLCLGKKAGVLPEAGVSPSGLNLKVPYFALDIPFPSLTVSTGKESAKIEVKLGSIDKHEHEKK